MIPQTAAETAARLRDAPAAVRAAVIRRLVRRRCRIVIAHRRTP